MTYSILAVDSEKSLIYLRNNTTLVVDVFKIEDAIQLHNDGIIIYKDNRFTSSRIRLFYSDEFIEFFDKCVESDLSVYDKDSILTEKYSLVITSLNSYIYVNGGYYTFIPSYKLNVYYLKEYDAIMVNPSNFVFDTKDKISFTQSHYVIPLSSMPIDIVEMRESYEKLYTNLFIVYLSDMYVKKNMDMNMFKKTILFK